MDALLRHLPVGRDAAKRKAALADELGWSEREVKRAVREARLAGYLVCSGNAGYWLASGSEVDEWIARQRSQISAMYVTLTAVERTYRLGNYQQTELFPAA